MVTLIRTLKRIITSPPPPSKNKPNESSKTKRISTPTKQQHKSLMTQAAPIVHRPRPQNNCSDLVYQNSQVQKTKAAVTDAVEMNKERDSSASSNQKAFAVAADTRDETSASIDSDEKNTQSDRKRKPSSTYMELPPKKVAYRKKICSSDGCTNQVIKSGVCIRHGATWTKKKCSSEGCSNFAKKGGVCLKHGAQKRLCRMEGCMNGVRNGGVCVRHGATKKLCSSEGCTNFAQKGGVCHRHRHRAEGK
eukprot:scaffold2799_cov126-Skeletonema_marinoi.AAC.5